MNSSPFHPARPGGEDSGYRYRVAERVPCGDGMPMGGCVRLEILPHKNETSAARTAAALREGSKEAPPVEAADRMEVIARPEDLRTYRVVHRRIVESHHEKNGRAWTHASEGVVTTTWRYDD